MNNLPLVSFLVPSFNHQDYIEYCLDSILNDPYKNKELVIIDDGSKDKSVGIIRRWIVKNKNFINVNFIARKNKGLTATLNELVKKSNGKFYRLIASDDAIIYNSTSIMLDHFNLNLNATCLFGDCRVIDSKNSCLYESSLKDLYKVNINNYLDRDKISQEIILNWSVSGPASIIKKSGLKSIGLYDESLNVEDWDMYLRLLSFNKLYFINAKVSEYRIHSANSSRSNNKLKRISNLLDMHKAANKNLSLFDIKRKKFLNAQIRLIEAKIFFLKDSYVQSFVAIIKYLYLNLFIFYEKYKF
jgi:glycosyltransferase involved in cell wall biosynthesis